MKRRNEREQTRRRGKERGRKRKSEEKREVGRGEERDGGRGEKEGGREGKEIHNKYNRERREVPSRHIGREEAGGGAAGREGIPTTPAVSHGAEHSAPRVSKEGVHGGDESAEEPRCLRRVGHAGRSPRYLARLVVHGHRRLQQAGHVHRTKPPSFAASAEAAVGGERSKEARRTGGGRVVVVVAVVAYSDG